MYTDYEEDNESYYSDDDKNNNPQNSEKIKKIAIFILIFVIFIVLILIIAKGCSKKNTNTNNNQTSANIQQTPTIMIGRETLSLDIGEEFELQADVLNTKNTNPIISWRSDDTSIASVNDEGFVKAEGEGVTAIIASYKENNKTYTNACVVTVTSNVVKLESIKLSQKSINLKIGGTFLIEVTTNPKDAKVDKFIYESADNDIASVNSKGYVLGITAGTTTITVKTEDGSISETMSVNVSEDKQTVTVIEPTGIEIIGYTNGLSVGNTTKAIVNITPSSATNTEVRWSSSNENIAKVDSNGTVTGISAGTCTIMASTSNNITATKEITVSSNIKSVEKVSIVGSTSITMKVGGTKYLYYTISPSDATNKKVAYKSSNPSVVYVDSNGIMAGVGVGTAIVTITTQDGGKTAVANVTVTASTASGTSSSSSTSSTSNDISSYNYNTSNYSNYNYQTDSSNYSTTYYESDNDVTTSSCNAYDILKITHNESKDIYPDKYAVVSTVSFDSTKPFTRSGITPTIEVIQFNNCIKFLNYTIYYGTTKDNVNTVLQKGKVLNAGEVIKLDNKNGYYRINITGQTNTEGIYLTKVYYAHVQKSTNEDYFSVTTTPISNGTKVTINKNNSSIKRIYYCVSKTTTDCDPSTGVVQNTISKDKTVYNGYFLIDSSRTISYTRNKGSQPTYKVGARVCFKPYNGTALVGDKICRNI